MSKNKTVGILLLVLPIVLLVLILVAYALMNLAMGPLVVGQDAHLDLVGEPDLRFMIGRIVNVILGFLGVLSVIGIIIGIPFGMYFLSKQGDGEDSLAKHAAYKGLTKEQREFIQSFTWEALLAPNLWAFSNQLWRWGVLSLIPFVNIYAWIMLMIKGRRMAWEKQQHWNGFVDFERHQRTVRYFFLAIVILLIGIAPLAAEYL